MKKRDSGHETQWMPNENQHIFKVPPLRDQHYIGVFPKWNGNSVNSTNSGNLINYWGLNCGQFKDPVSHLCLAGDVVASWSLTQEMAALNPFTVMTNIFSHWIQRIQWKHLKKTQLVFFSLCTCSMLLVYLPLIAWTSGAYIQPNCCQTKECQWIIQDILDEYNLKGNPWL